MSKQSGQVGGGVGFAGAAAERVDGNDLGHGSFHPLIMKLFAPLLVWLDAPADRCNLQRRPNILVELAAGRRRRLTR